MSNLSYSGALYDCALECALRRRNRRCHYTFHSAGCSSCKWYIGNYTDADIRHLNLFMTQAELQAGAIKATSGHHHFVFVVLISICLYCAWITYKGDWTIDHNDRPSLPSLVKEHIQLPVAQETVTPPSAPLTVQQTSDAILVALRKVAQDMNRRVDVNKDGLVNCIDAAVLFYKYYPDKKNATISINKNSSTNMNHLFNVVLIGDTWRAIEPQAVYANKSSYFMRDIWKSQYDARLNRDVTQDYLRYVK